jgi:hypothetical protein
VRDLIETKVKELLAELDVPAARHGGGAGEIRRRGSVNAFEHP